MSGAVTPLTRLGTLARRTAEAQERCELCGAAIAPEHRHLLDVSKRELMCACRACSILFASEAASAGRYRLVGERRLRVEDLELDDVAWEELRLPVEMAFFFHNSAAGRVQAFYPSPMGPTESLLGLEAWAALEAANPVLTTLEPDVEALLVNRVRGVRGHWIVPIDDCYALVGLIRTRWRGLTGGAEVWEGIARFFEELDRRARPASRNHGLARRT
jgi:Family of unknown function (DUF5947)